MKDTKDINTIANKLSPVNSRSYLAKTFKKIILNKFKNIKIGFIEVVDEDETYCFGDNNSNLRAKVYVLSKDFYVMLGSGGELGVSEAYAAGIWKSDDLVNLIRIIFKNKDVMWQLESIFTKIISPINKFIHWKRKNSLKGSKKNILAHYDLSNEFYKLWLDNTMTYSCGIFNDKNSTLKEASIEKIDRICRKLNLKTTDHLLEIGTGWGSFSMHAAKEYGCQITTTTISEAQFTYVNDKIRKLNLEDKIMVLNKDYRHLDGEYDKIVSIEMIEAVGYKYMPVYFKTISNLLKNDGLFAMQGITYNDQNFDIYKSSMDFIKRYIFPGSCLISISQVAEVMKKYTDLSILHLEDITTHYAQTLKKWRENFINELPAIKELGFSSEFINLWEFYFVYCEAGFRERNIGDYQFIFSKPGLNDIEINY